MPKDISGIFWRLPYEKEKECEQGGIELTSLIRSTDPVLDHGYLVGELKI